MTRRCAWLGLLFALLAALPALATVGFAYRWKGPQVAVRWSEGNDGPDTPGLRREVAHWKRLAETLWSAAPPLTMDVSLYGPEVGSEGPRVALACGGRRETVAAPITQEKVLAALLKVRGAGGDEPAPPDDTEPRVSPDGQWIAAICWRGGPSEVWVAKRDAETVTRIPFAPDAPLTERLILTTPEWSPDSRQVGWVQGGRVVLFDVRQRYARFVTPADQHAVAVQWPPRAQLPLLVRFADDSFALLDAVSGTLIPISEMIRGAAPMGECYWSPSGRRIAFKTQSRIEVAALTVPGKAASAWDRFLGKLLGGPPEPPQSREGVAAERLAVLDLGARRMDGYALEGTPLDSQEISSLGWTYAEDAVIAGAGGPDQGWKLILFPFPAAGGATTGRSSPGRTLLESPQPLAALGWRAGRPLRADEAPTPADLVQEAIGPQGLLRGAAGEGLDFQPVTPTGVRALALAPGPLGGYLGAESEEEGTLTGDEPGRLIILEPGNLNNVDHVRRRFPTGFTAHVLQASPMLPLIEALAPPVGGPAATRRAVDLDYVWDKDRSLAVAMLGGGCGRLVTVGLHPQDARRAVETDFTAEISGATATAIEPRDEPFELTDVSTGTSTVALRYSRPDPNRVLILSAVILLGFILIIYVLRRRLGR